MLVLAIGGVWVIRQQATAEAIRDARGLTAALGRGVVEANLEELILEGDPGSLARLDATLRQNVLSPQIVRAKLWSSDGRVLYSDDPRSIGAQFEDAERSEALAKWTSLASVSDLSRSENEYERQFGKLLEVYQPLRTPSGTPVVLEMYHAYDTVSANSATIFLKFVPVLLGALVLLQVIQVPLAWSMAGRVQAGQVARERLLDRAVRAQELERRRIARDVHDGIVQDLIGLSLRLSSSAQGIGRDSAADRDALQEAARGVRSAVRGLRGFLVDIYPPSLEQAGLAAGLSDLLEPLRSRGVAVELHLEGESRLDDTRRALVYRAAQEATRNILRHATPSRVEVRLDVADGVATLCVTDDGGGFDAGRALAEAGHFGLTMLQDLAHESGGEFTIESGGPTGTRLELSVPVS